MVTQTFAQFCNEAKVKFGGEPQTMGSRQSQKLKSFRGFEVSVIGIATKHTTKFISSAISLIPSTAGRTVLRRLPGVFPFQPNPFDLATPFEQINGIGVLPMRQSSVHVEFKK
jgi:hypothetical protein